MKSQSSQRRFTEEFKEQAVRQVTDRGYAVSEVADRLGVSSKSLYTWLKRYSVSPELRVQKDEQSAENRRLRAELKRVSEERDILKKGRSVLRQAVRVRYDFIKDHEAQHAVRRMCSVMQVHPGGYYAWKSQPVSARAMQDQRISVHIKQCWEDSGQVYGYRKVARDLHEMGESCGKHRVARLMRLAGLRSHTGYGRRPGSRGKRPSVVAPDVLQRQFQVDAPNQVWVTDITYIARMKVGSILRRCWTCFRAKSSDGLWEIG